MKVTVTIAPLTTLATVVATPNLTNISTDQQAQEEQPTVRYVWL